MHYLLKFAENIYTSHPDDEEKVSIIKFVLHLLDGENSPDCICISTNGTGLWCCSLGYPVLHQGRAALGVAFERTPIKWKTRMPDRTRCAESDAFYIHVRYYLNLHIVRIEPAWRGNEPKATPYAQERHGGENPHGREGIFPPPPQKATLASFISFFVACWVG